MLRQKRSCSRPQGHFGGLLIVLKFKVTERLAGKVTERHLKGTNVQFHAQDQAVPGVKPQQCGRAASTGPAWPDFLQHAAFQQGVDGH